MKRKAYSRGERKEMILNVFYSSISDGRSSLFSAYGMAKMLGLNSAQHVRSIMEEMVQEGTLTFAEYGHRPNIDKRMYCPRPLVDADWKKLPDAPRIKINGKAV